MDVLTVASYRCQKSKKSVSNTYPAPKAARVRVNDTLSQQS